MGKLFKNKRPERPQIESCLVHMYFLSYYKMNNYESFFTIFEASFIFWGRWNNSKNWLEPEQTTLSKSEITGDSDKLVSWFVQTTPRKNRPFQNRLICSYYFSEWCALSGCSLYANLSVISSDLWANLTKLSLRHWLSLAKLWKKQQHFGSIQRYRTNLIATLQI